MNLADLYTDIIKEHSASGHNKHHLPHSTIVMPGKNPSCGDEIELELEEDHQTIQDASFTGVGCAISQASISIMIDLVKGKTLQEVKKLAELFLSMCQREPLTDEELDQLEEAAALQNVANLPARVKCASMPWHTLLKAIEEIEQK